MRQVTCHFRVVKFELQLGLTTSRVTTYDRLNVSVIITNDVRVRHLAIRSPSVRLLKVSCRCRTENNTRTSYPKCVTTLPITYTRATRVLTHLLLRSLRLTTITNYRRRIITLSVCVPDRNTINVTSATLRLRHFHVRGVSTFTNGINGVRLFTVTRRVRNVRVSTASILKDT